MNSWNTQLIARDLHRQQVDRRRYPRVWRALNAELQALEMRDGHLVGALERLRSHQLATGFIRDDLHAVQCYRFPHPDDPRRFLSVQYNPERVNRLKLRLGDMSPPRGDAVNNNCYLCSSNIQWQHHGIEFGYAIEQSGVHYNIWMNAYPLMPQHLVVATRKHMPQAWVLRRSGASRFSIRRIVGNLAALAMRMPGYIGFYNGEGAGASVPTHFHYQFFRRREDVPHFPLELAPVRALDECSSVVEGYPVDGMRWQSGDHAAVIRQATDWIRDWLCTRTGLRPSLSANIFAMYDADTGMLRIYFVPRDRELCYSPHMAGMIGSLEILGELVLTTAQEKHDLDRGEIDYRSIERILHDIHVPL